MNALEQLSTDILSTAVEGGINYWAAVSEVVRDDEGNYISLLVHETDESADPKTADHATHLTTENFFGLQFYELKGKLVTPDLILGAIMRIRLFSNKTIPTYMSQSLPAFCREALVNPEEAAYDSAVADEILQFAVLGEVKYG